MFGKCLFPLKTYLFIYIYVALPVFITLFLNKTPINLPIIFWHICASLGLLLPFVIFPKLQTFFAIVYLIIYTLCALDLSHFIIFKSSLTESVVLTVLDASMAEIKDFFRHFMTLSAILLISLYCLTAIIFCKHICQNKKYPSRNLYLIAICEILFLLSVYRGFHSLYPNQYRLLPYRIADSIINYYSNKNELISSLKKFKSINISGLKSQNPYNQKETYIVVIGESATRNRLKYYNYTRDTTPYSSEIIKPFVFTNIKSAHTITVLSLKEALTLRQNGNYIGSLIDIFRLSGFKTFWLSNQYYSGEDSNLTNIYAYTTDSIIFTNEVKSYLYETGRHSYDYKLIPHLDKALRDKAQKKIIFIHLAGSHFPYNLRYPANFNFFSASNTSFFVKEFNDYDNSIRYTDYILSVIVKKISNLQEQSFVLYFSDHGEDITLNPESCHCHSASPQAQTASMFEIPFLLWTNHAFNQSNPRLIKKLPSYLNRSFNTRNLIHSLPTLAGLSFAKQQAEKNLFSPLFIPEPK